MIIVKRRLQQKRHIKTGIILNIYHLQIQNQRLRIERSGYNVE